MVNFHFIKSKKRFIEKSIDKCRISQSCDGLTSSSDGQGLICHEAIWSSIVCDLSSLDFLFQRKHCFMKESREVK